MNTMKISGISESELDDLIFETQKEVGYVYCLDRNNIYIGCNDQQAKAFGLASTDEVIGLTNYDLPTVESPVADIWNQNNLEVMESGEPKYVKEPAILEDGSHAVVISNKIPLFDTEENVIGLLGISRLLP
jgi:two-component system aerobic respiration control sensor histidine kinase ArcB